MADRIPTFAFIPARAGSKGLPNKNLRELAGKPLIAHSIEAALGSGVCDEVLVSSDGEEILAAAQLHGAEALARPSELAADDSPTALAVKHAIEACEMRGDYIIILLQATSPLRTADHVREAYMSYLDGRLPIIGIDGSPAYAQKYLFLSDDGTVSPCVPEAATMPRQALTPSFKPNGAIYIFSVEQFLSCGDVPIDGARAYRMNGVANVDIDDADDLALAQLVLENEDLFNRKS